MLRVSATAGVEQNRPTSIPLTRLVGGEGEIAGRDQLASGCRGDAVDFRNHRLGKIHDDRHELRAERERFFEERLAPVSIGAVRAHLLEVVARGEEFPRRGDDDDANAVVVLGSVELGEERFHHGERQQVRRRIVQRQAKHRSCALRGNERVRLHIRP